MNDKLYAQLRGLGFNGPANQMLYDYYGGPATTMPQREYEWLGRKGYVQNTLPDRWAAYLRTFGVGSVSDILYRNSDSIYGTVVAVELAVKQTSAPMRAGTAATGTMTFSSNVTAGSYLIVVLATYLSAITSVVGSTNGAFTEVFSGGSGSDNIVRYFVKANAIAGPETITVTPTTPADSYVTGTAMEVSGVSGVDRTALAVGSLSVTAAQPNTTAKSLVITTTVNNVGGTDTFTVPTGYTVLDRDTNGDTSTAHIASYKITSAIETSTSTVTTPAQAANTYDSLMVTFSATEAVPLLSLNSRIIYFGDSLSNYDKYDGRKQYTNILHGGRYYTPPGFNQGVSGNTTNQMLARISTVLDLIIPGKTLVPFLGGTNDPAGSISPATSISNIGSIVTQLLNAGAKVLIHTIWKRGNPQANYIEEAKRLEVNTFIRSLSTTPGVTVLDVDSIYNPETMSDEPQGLHPNPLGALTVATAESAITRSLINSPSILAGQTGNFLVNPQFTGTGGTLTNATATGVVANNWRLYRDAANPNGTVVGSKEVGADGIERQVVSVTADANGACYGYFETAAIVPTGGLAGELFEAWAGVEFENSTDLMTTSALQIIWNGRALNGCTFGGLDHAGVYRTIPTALSADQPTGIRLQFLIIAQANSTTTVKLRSPMARKVPTGQ